MRFFIFHHTRQYHQILLLCLIALVVTTVIVQLPPAEAANSETTTHTKYGTMQEDPTSLDLYVSTNGNNQNPGTLEKPFRTIQKGVDEAVPGTTIYVRDGVYAEQVEIGVSGSEDGGYITLQSYPGEQAIIDGQTIDLPRSEALLTIDNQHHLRVTDLTIRNAIGILPFAVSISGPSHHIEFTHNEVTGIKTTDAWARGFTADNARADASMNNIIVSDNSFSDIPNTLGEMVAFSGNVEQVQVVRNHVSGLDGTAIGINFLGNYDGIDDPNVGFARDSVAADNTIQDGGICLYVDGASRITFERNLTINCRPGIQIASEKKEVDAYDNIVRNNAIIGCRDFCFAFGGWVEEYGEAVNTLVVNNTIYNPDEAQVVMLNRSRGGKLFNNIIVGKDGALLRNNGVDDVELDYNLWYSNGDAGFNWDGTWFTSFAAYQQSIGTDVHSFFDDPLLDDIDLTPPDIQLNGDSPAINAGDAGVKEIGDIDYKDQPRVVGDSVDIGAYEYQNDTAAQPVPDKQAITSFILVNADTGEDIQVLQEGAVIDPAEIGTNNMSIRAETSSPVGSVRFGLNGNKSFHLENFSPYTLQGDFNQGKGYLPWTPDANTYTLTATPFEHANAQGVVGIPLKVTFTVSH